MTQLSKLNNTSRYDSVKVIDVKAITVFYVHTGRNAWHSTWIARYSPGCMHTTLHSAKSYAETNRVQGTTFNISEMPALFIKSSAGSVVVIQINTLKPLSGYSRIAVREKHHTHPLIEGHLDDYLCAGAPMHGAILSFARDSRFWTNPPPPENSIILTETLLAEPPTVPIKSPNVNFKSYSHGSQYLMGWSENKSDIHSKWVASLII